MLESLTYHACLVAAGAKAHWQLLSLSSAKALDRIKQVHFQGFPSAYLAKHHPPTSPPFWTAGMPGCLYSDKLPAALLKGQAPLFSAPCNCSNLFPWVSFHSIYHRQLSFPPKCFYTFPSLEWIQQPPHWSLSAQITHLWAGPGMYEMSDQDLRSSDQTQMLWVPYFPHTHTVLPSSWVSFDNGLGRVRPRPVTELLDERLSKLFALPSERMSHRGRKPGWG